MKILLTGGTGQVGREIIRRAGRRPLFEVVAPGRDQLELTQRASVERAVQQYAPDLVINAGAYTAVDRAEDEPVLAHTINGEAPGWLGSACAAASVPVIHFSTDYVYAGDKSGAYLETDPTAPLGVYGASKLQGERALLASGADSLILRVSWVFAGHGGNFVKTMLRLGAERDELRVVADQRGGPTYAGHIAEAALDLAARYESPRRLPWGIYHYAGAPLTSWHEFAQTILQRAFEKQLIRRVPTVQAISTRDYPTRSPRPGNSEMDCSRAESLLGLQRPDWRLGLEETLEELRV
ncbi:MAG: NAD(P)-dependent oxidoreductase [Hydrocarboniphaga sp.]|uniref:dTDP-4-dehydrorhamnose reductase n=1 Tax=Hydrocarboniphaga sp. TaxID=2033016 RepID=UPI00260F8E37|nr:dTDP-4-dehydrorhamnose reductase [Hydrocarboniphaga sp.]MDB5972495.1 NAD(P)-dependent oxidoreductase [Hydrocarboniphaga sp.]